MTFVCIVTDGILLFCFSDTSNYIRVDSPFEALQNDTTARKFILGQGIEHKDTTILDTEKTIILTQIRSISIEIT